jgi:hypothetical protein
MTRLGAPSQRLAELEPRGERRSTDGFAVLRRTPRRDQVGRPFEATDIPVQHDAESGSLLMCWVPK